MGGIQGRLNKQFAITIAHLGADLGVQRADALARRSAAMLLKPHEGAKGPLGTFFAWFNRVFATATDGYVELPGHLIRKVVRQPR